MNHANAKSSSWGFHAILGCVWGIAAWVIVIVVSVVLEIIFALVTGDSRAALPGLAPAPIFVVSGVLFGWIPAAFVGYLKSRS